MKLHYDKKEFITIHDTFKEMWMSAMQLGMAALEQNRILTEKRLDIEIARLDLEKREQELRQQFANQVSAKQAQSTGKTFTYGYTTGSHDAK